MLIFSGLFNIVATKPHTLFRALQLVLKGGGEVFFGDLGSHPIPGLLGSGGCQPALPSSWEEEEVGRGQAGQIGGLF